MIGQVLDGRYRVLEKLGEGGMGEVYAAEHIHIEKRVAIKLLRSEIVTNKEAVSRFRQEARSASSIGHKNIISIEDFGTIADGRVYLCMELLDGQPFNDLIQTELPVDRLLNILIQTGHGLAAAHAKGIVHRDMKPENIFVTEGDVPKLLDLGIAKVSGNHGNNHLTRTGTIFGTPFYMAPEQALGQAVDHRADIYAMGVILYEVFTGSIPFQGESFMGILTQHITAEPKPVTQMAAEHGKTVPPGIEAVIVRAMKKEPDERYQTMDELVNALVAVYRGVAGSGMSSYMEAHAPASAMMKTIAAPSASMPVANLPSATPVPTPHPGYANSPPQASYPPQRAPTPTPMPIGASQSQPHYPGNPASSGHYSSSSSLFEQPKKSKVPLIILLVTLLAIGGGGITLFLMKSGGEKDKDAGPVIAANDAGRGTADATRIIAKTTDAGITKTTDASPIDAGSHTVIKRDAASQAVSVRITSRPRAKVTRGRKTLGQTPLEITIRPNETVILKLAKKGYHSETLRVNDRKKTWSARLKKHIRDSGGGDGDGDSPPDPCVARPGSVACKCQRPKSRDCICAKNPRNPVCDLE